MVGIRNEYFLHEPEQMQVFDHVCRDRTRVPSIVIDATAIYFLNGAPCLYDSRTISIRICTGQIVLLNVGELSSLYLTCRLCLRFLSLAGTNRKHITKEKYFRT
jgi:hypothetical protein